MFYLKRSPKKSKRENGISAYEVALVQERPYVPFKQSSYIVSSHRSPLLRLLVKLKYQSRTLYSLISKSRWKHSKYGTIHDTTK